jgi:hypothetical protein
MKTLFAASALALGLAASHAAGQTGAPPLDPVLEGQLERWLGAGDQIFENIYTRQGAGNGAPADTSLDFHAAADGRGPTFTLLRVSDRAERAWLVGGYNPQSWDSDDGWHFTPRDFQRTAFLFNYTAPAVYRQVPVASRFPARAASRLSMRSIRGRPSAPVPTCSSATTSTRPCPGA